MRFCRVWIWVLILIFRLALFGGLRRVSRFGSFDEKVCVQLVIEEWRGNVSLPKVLHDTDVVIEICLSSSC